MGVVVFEIGCSVPNTGSKSAGKHTLALPLTCPLQLVRKEVSDASLWGFCGGIHTIAKNKRILETYVNL